MARREPEAGEMRSSYRKTTVLGGLVALLSIVVVTHDASASDWDTDPLSTAVTSQHYLCGKNDLPEGPIQGDVPKADQDSGRAQQGYNCGLAFLGYTPLDFDERPNSNAGRGGRGRQRVRERRADACSHPEESGRVGHGRDDQRGDHPRRSVDPGRRAV